MRGRDSSGGIGTRYGLGGPEFESRLAERFSVPSRPGPRPTQTPVKWVQGLPGGKGTGARCRPLTF
jgi:hypothetical protein